MSRFGEIQILYHICLLTFSYYRHAKLFATVIASGNCTYVMFVWWEAPINMRAEWKYASMTSGGQCVMMAGAVLMQLWSASSWDMQPLEVSANNAWWELEFFTLLYFLCRWNCIQQCLLWCWYWTHLPG